MNTLTKIHIKKGNYWGFENALSVFLFVSLCFLSLGVDDLLSQVRVRGYFRKDGTYVQPHVRSTPDGNPYNNYSFPGNYNPNTGTTTPGNSESYLRRYYNQSNADDSEFEVDIEGYYRNDGTYVGPHKRSAPDGNPYNNYSFPGNYNPNTGTTTPGKPKSYFRRYRHLRNIFGNSTAAILVGSDIPEIQNALGGLGYDTGTVDQIYGASTGAAISKFEQSAGMPVNRELTAETTEKLIERVDALNASRLQNRAEADVNSALPAVSTIPIRVDNTQVTQGKSEENYRKAITSYFQFDYTEAIELFSQFLKENPNHNFADNAQYWIGDSYFMLRNYQKSIEELRKVLSFANNEKHGDTYLRIGLCYLELHNNDQARHYLDQVMIHFRETNQARRASQILAKITSQN